MSDQENRDQLQCSVRNERQQQQRGDTEGNVMHRTQGRQGREDRRSCSRNAKCSGESRQVTRLGPTQYTDLGLQPQTFPELITCVTLPLCNIPSRVLSRFPQSQSREETAARSPAGSPETFSLCYPDPDTALSAAFLAPVQLHEDTQQS